MATIGDPKKNLVLWSETTVGGRWSNCSLQTQDAARQERLRIKYNDRRLKRRRDRMQQQRNADAV